jgi:hypothetical protein
MSSPASSSSSSYDSVFDRSGSRATTPSSIVSDTFHDKVTPTSHLPNTCVCLFSTSLEYDVVKAIFSKHSNEGRLGLYVPLATSRGSSSTFEGWNKETICPGDIDVEYLLSSRDSTLGELDCSVSA